MFKSCLDLVTFPRHRELVILQSNSVCCLFGRRPLFRGQVWMVSQKPHKGSGIVLPITAISTHGPNLPSEVARSTSNSSHKHLRTTQTKWTYIEWRALLCPPDFVPPGFVDVLPITHTHTHTSHMCPLDFFTPRMCPLDGFTPGFVHVFTNTFNQVKISRVHASCMSTRCQYTWASRSVSTHTPHTPTNHGNQVNIKRVDHTWCRRGVAAHTPHTPMHHRNHEERARINHNYVSTRILSSWFCLFVPKTHTHTHTAPHTPHVCKPRRGQKYSDSGQAPFWTLPGIASFRAALF